MLNALDSKENIMKAAEIPQNLCLSDKIAFNEFVKYMNSQVLSNFNSPDSPYLVHQGKIDLMQAGLKKMKHPQTFSTSQERMDALLPSNTLRTARSLSSH